MPDTLSLLLLWLAPITMYACASSQGLEWGSSNPPVAYEDEIAGTLGSPGKVLSVTLSMSGADKEVQVALGAQIITPYFAVGADWARRRIRYLAIKMGSQARYYPLTKRPFRVSIATALYGFSSIAYDQHQNMILILKPLPHLRLSVPDAPAPPRLRLWQAVAVENCTETVLSYLVSPEDTLSNIEPQGTNYHAVENAEIEFSYDSSYAEGVQLKYYSLNGAVRTGVRPAPDEALHYSLWSEERGTIAMYAGGCAQ